MQDGACIALRANPAMWHVCHVRFALVNVHACVSVRTCMCVYVCMYFRVLHLFEKGMVKVHSH